MRNQGETPPVFELVTRAGCHLCEEMEDLLREVLPPLGLRYRPLDIDRDPALSERFTDVVPVLLRDGKPVAKIRLDRRQLLRIVHRRAREAASG